MNANMLKVVAVFFTLAWLSMGVGTLTTLSKLPVGVQLKRAEPAIVLQLDSILVTPKAAQPAHAKR